MTGRTVVGAALLGSALAMPAGMEASGQTASTDALEKPAMWPDAHEPFKVLVFSKTMGFRHDSIPAGVEAVRRLGRQFGFEVTATEDAAAFTPGHLESFRVVLFLSTTGDVLNEKQQSALEQYMQAGGGFVGIHAASDTEFDWPWYGRLVGTYFKCHPASQHADVHVEIRDTPSTVMLPDRWRRFDEWYDFRDRPSGVEVLATVDEESYSGATFGNPHPISWQHAFDGGRVWYTAMGHTRESFSEPLFLLHLLGGIQYAAGLEPIPDE